MPNQTPFQWATAFSQDLVLDGERVPFERVLKLHRGAIVTLRGRGLTWDALANLLCKAGVTRAGGKPYSGDHLRVSFNRLGRRSASTEGVGEEILQQISYAAPPDRSHHEAGGQIAIDTKSFSERQSPSLSSKNAKQLLDHKEISDAELASALNRINNRRGN